MYLIYSLLYTIAILILFIPQYLKRPKELRKRWAGEKLGYLPEIGHAIWIHAVSVGEVNASIPFIKKLKEQYPGVPVVLSTITDTGQMVAAEKAPGGTKVIYLPFDLKFVLERCLKRINPRIFVVIETELWPNIFRVMADKGVPVIVLNGRISEKSSRGYRKLSFFMKRVFSYVRVFGMQSRVDADRLKNIGADEKKILVLGNFKFDMNIQRKILPWAEDIKGRVIVAGSTHSGEEEIIISACRDNLERFPELKLILAPRHPERFKEVEALLGSQNISFVKRSELGDLKRQGLDPKVWVILLDSIGELSSVYGIADIAVMGKSFAGFGGQNPLEPAYWGKPIICGTHMENFSFINDFYREGAAFEVDAAALAKKIRELLVSPEKAEYAGEKAKALYVRNSGAVDRAVDVVKEYINTT
ncbi:MAG: 3-deoxy-D-manno-octulosonic acid transferase [Nitrospirota bacterium]